MVKILYVHNSLDTGGAQAVRYLFLKNLGTRLLDIHICCLGEKGEFGKRIETLGYRVDAFNNQYGLSQLATTLNLYRYIKHNNFDIVHSSLFYANYHSALAASWAKTPLFITEEHGEHSLHLKKKHILYRLVGQRVSRTSDRILCCSDSVKQGVKSAYGADDDKITVLKNLIEDKRSEIKRRKEEVRAEFNIPDDTIVLGTVSSIYWVKNQKILIDAVSQPDYKKFFLLIVGDGPLKQELIKYSQMLGLGAKVYFTGWREDVADMLNAMDIFILPSFSEGLPVCLLEAMSIGLPCIASRVGGIEEVVRDGITGLIVKPGNLSDLNRAVARLIDNDDLRQRLGLAARIYVKEHFQPSFYVDKVLSVYFNFLKDQKMESL